LPYSGLVDTYSGGGYVWKITQPTMECCGREADIETVGERIQKLIDENWIDHNTRAVFVEFSLFNPALNMFAVNWLLLEAPMIGAFVPSYRFDPFRLMRYHTDFAAMNIAFEVAFVIYIIFYIIKEIRNLKRLGFADYFKEPWHWVELLIIAISLAGIFFYLARFFETERCVDKLEALHGNTYIKFQVAATFDESGTVMLAFVLFLGTMKLLRLMRVNERLNTLTETLHRARPDLIGFFIIFAIFYTAFCTLFYLVLSPLLTSFSSYLLTLEEAFSAILSKFDMGEIRGASGLASMFFMLFMFFQTVLLLQMFVVIVVTMFHEVRSDILERSRDHEILVMLISKIRRKLEMPVPPRPLNPHELHGQDMDTLDTLEARSNKLVELLNKKFHDDPMDPVKIERTTRRRIKTDNEKLRQQFGIAASTEKKKSMPPPHQTIYLP
uniref:Uncharacterized protein n=1 Tax=Plectus sambesii TaxID=2011161 RepID=A0A914X5V1_9BILA